MGPRVCACPARNICINTREPISVNVAFNDGNNFARPYIYKRDTANRFFLNKECIGIYKRARSGAESSHQIMRKRDMKTMRCNVCTYIYIYICTRSCRWRRVLSFSRARRVALNSDGRTREINTRRDMLSGLPRGRDAASRRKLKCMSRESGQPPFDNFKRRRVHINCLPARSTEAQAFKVNLPSRRGGLSFNRVARAREKFMTRAIASLTSRSSRGSRGRKIQY